MWADHRVKAGGDAGYEMRHPLVGALTVTQQTLRTEDGQAVVVATTEPGSPSQAAMTLLVHAAAPAAADTRQPLPARRLTRHCPPRQRRAETRRALPPACPSAPDPRPPSAPESRAPHRCPSSAPEPRPPCPKTEGRTMSQEAHSHGRRCGGRRWPYGGGRRHRRPSRSPPSVRPGRPAPRITAHFDLAKGQTAGEHRPGPRRHGLCHLRGGPAGRRRSPPAGATRVLATLPAPADGGVNTPVLGFALTTGIVRDRRRHPVRPVRHRHRRPDRASGGCAPGGTPRRIAALPGRRAAQRPGAGPADRHALRHRLGARHHLDRPATGGTPTGLVHRARTRLRPASSAPTASRSAAARSG